MYSVLELFCSKLYTKPFFVSIILWIINFEVKLTIFILSIHFVNSLFFSPVHHPGLKALWNSDRKSPHHRNKWKLFLGAISPCIHNITDWISLSDDIVVSTAACYYLYYVRILLYRYFVLLR